MCMQGENQDEKRGEHLSRLSPPPAQACLATQVMESTSAARRNSSDGC